MKILKYALIGISLSFIFTCALANVEPIPTLQQLPDLKVNVVYKKFNSSQNFYNYEFYVVGGRCTGKPCNSIPFDQYYYDFSKNSFSVPRIGHHPIARSNASDRTGTVIAVRKEGNTTGKSDIYCLPAKVTGIKSWIEKRRIFPYKDKWISDDVNKIYMIVDFKNDSVPHSCTVELRK